MAGTAAGIISTSGAALSAPPPPNGNIFERLSAHGISWRNYYSDLPSLAILLAFAQQNPDKLTPIAQFFADAAAGTLPAVSLVDPRVSERRAPRRIRTTSVSASSSLPA